MQLAKVLLSSFHNKVRRTKKARDSCIFVLRYCTPQFDHSNLNLKYDNHFGQSKIKTNHGENLDLNSELPVDWHAFANIVLLFLTSY